jgi:hypothetical protein
MVILEQNRCNRRLFPLFPYLLIYRAEEAAGSNPARSTGIPRGRGIQFYHAYIWGFGDWCEGFSFKSCANQLHNRDGLFELYFGRYYQIVDQLRTTS